MLEKIAQLLTLGLAVYPLRGNHEAGLLDFDERGKLKKLNSAVKKRNSRHLLNGRGRLKAGVSHFLSHLPYFFETPDEYLVHAGFDTSAERPFEQWESMLTIRSFRYDNAIFDGKPIFHGHIPTSFRRINRALETLDTTGKQPWKTKTVVLDNGCVNVTQRNQGCLACLELNSLALMYFRNSDVTEK